jgi:site-specific recombinase XerD
MDIKRLINSKNALANKVLKQLAEMAGIQTNVSFHIARHSFADYARKSNMNLYDISKALGHSDIKVTEQYLESFDNQSLTDSMSKLFG